MRGAEEKLLAPDGASSNWELNESVDKPGSVVDDHSSATGVTTCL
jgi:hypothetical protein